MRRHNAWESRKLLQKDPPYTTNLPPRPKQPKAQRKESQNSPACPPCVYWTVGKAGHYSQRVRTQGGRRHQLLQLGSLADTVCHSSSSQTMRVIFSQCSNTSQLAGVQGGSPLPSSPPRQQAGQSASPAHGLQRCHLHVTVCLSCFSTTSPNSPAKLQSCQRETKKIRV